MSSSVPTTAAPASIACYVSEPEPGGEGDVCDLTGPQVMALLAAGYHVQAADAEDRYTGRPIAEVLAGVAPTARA